MTEDRWIRCLYPSDMLLWLPAIVETERRVLLLLAALSGEEYPKRDQCLQFGLEQYADGAISHDELNALFQTSGSEYGAPLRFTAESARYSIAPSKPARVQATRLIRDIFGNPFRPVTFDPRWQSETVVALATGIYAERAFDRMPILADALEDAGCDHADILAHCRGDGPHVRGCWVVDLVLGKS